MTVQFLFHLLFILVYSQIHLHSVQTSSSKSEYSSEKDGNQERDGACQWSDAWWDSLWQLPHSFHTSSVTRSKITEGSGVWISKIITGFYKFFTHFWTLGTFFKTTGMAYLMLFLSLSLFFFPQMYSLCFLNRSWVELTQNSSTRMIYLLSSTSIH